LYETIIVISDIYYDLAITTLMIAYLHSKFVRPGPTVRPLARDAAS